MQSSKLLQALAESPERVAERLLVLKNEREESKRFLFDPAAFICERLKWEPWAGTDEEPGQLQIIEWYEKILRQLHEKHDFDLGVKQRDQLEYWQPGQLIKNRGRLVAGASVGKTKLASGLFNHFFETHDDAIIYTFAPSYPQINDLLWKEIRNDRAAAGFSVQPLQTPFLKAATNHFAIGRATNDSHGHGGTRIQGQHSGAMMFILDEAEGVPSFVWEAVERMTQGLCVVLMLANPESRTSDFYRARLNPSVQNFRISCLGHPNVIHDRLIVPGGATSRQWVKEQIEKHCTIVDEHDPDKYTFELPWRPGVIYLPNNECLKAVLGIPPDRSARESVCTPGRLQTAARREVDDSHQGWATIALDMADTGKDKGVISYRLGDLIGVKAKMDHGVDDKYQTTEYMQHIYELGERFLEAGVKRLFIRIDAGGGFHVGVRDALNLDTDFQGRFEAFNLELVNFGVPSLEDEEDDLSYGNRITEIYFQAAEVFKVCRIEGLTETLEGDFTERDVGWKLVKGRSVRVLEQKERFKRRLGRSPDEGDAVAMAAVPPLMWEEQGGLGWLDGWG